MKRRLAITMGDPAGIGPEITVKALSGRRPAPCIPIVIGDTAPLAEAIRMTSSPLRLHALSSVDDATGDASLLEYINTGALPKERCPYGEISAACGDAAFAYVVKGIDLAMRSKVDAVVTGPISKEAIQLAGHAFAGHTEIFAHYTGTSRYAMMLVSGALRVIHVTTHVSLRQACDLIRTKRVLETIVLARDALVSLGIEDGRIGVAGLNPHSGEGGLFGDEERNEIAPAIEKAVAMGISAEGPVPPDTVFVKALGGRYDMVVAMYHDQGHIPLKLAGFTMDEKTGTFSSMRGVNVTLGLPIIRTSVDHGTAYDRAGKNMANEESMVEAMEMALLLAENRHRAGGAVCSS